MNVTLLICGAAGLLLVPTALASAQDSFADLHTNLKTGQTVSITDESGTETKGRFVSAGGSIRLMVDGAVREWAPQQVREIRRRGDSVRNGLVVGMSTGGAFGAFFGLVAASTLRNEGTGAGSAFLMVPIGIGVGAGIGVGLDAAVTGSTVVYRRPARSVSIAPAISPRAQAIRVAVVF